MLGGSKLNSVLTPADCQLLAAAIDGATCAYAPPNTMTLATSTTINRSVHFLILTPSSLRIV